MKRTDLDTLLQARAAREPVGIVTLLASGGSAIVRRGDATCALGDDAVAAVGQALHDDRSATVDLAAGRAFVHAINPQLRVLVVGAVHIAQLLVPMARAAGLAPTVIDPRTAFASEARFPGVEIVAKWPEQALRERVPDPRTAVLSLSHDPKFDDPALSAALRSEAFYIGALGSRKTHAARCERLVEAGFSNEECARVRGPAGLAIGARTPGEIAVSILAEIVQVLRGAG